MAENEQEESDSRTEEPTERRILNALEKGDVPFSKEVSLFMSFLGILLCTIFLASSSLGEINRILQTFFDTADTWHLERAGDLEALMISLILSLSKPLVSVMGLFLCLGIAASFVQGFPRFALDRITPKLARISPRQGWRRLISLVGLLEFLKTLLKLFCVLSAIGFTLSLSFYHLNDSLFIEASQIPPRLIKLTGQLMATTCLVLFVIMSGDIIWSRLRWRHSLRMSRHEVKEERRQSEGDPIVKAHLRSLALDRARKRMMAGVPRATLVVVNPTHYAVALRYIRTESKAPIVVAKGKDLIALKIREIAEEHTIPIVEDKPLARSLYDAVQVDQMIPPDFYRAIAELIYVLQRRR